MKTPRSSLKNKAYAYLTRREHGYHELYVKLQKHTQDLSAIKQVLDELKHENALSEERYISSYLGHYQSKYGIKKIRYNLLQKKVDPDILDKVLVGATDEYTVACTIWQRKFGAPALDNKERLRQIRFLQNRGFSFEVITKILSPR